MKNGRTSFCRYLQFDFVTVAGAASSDDERKNEREELKPQLQHDQDNLVTNLGIGSFEQSPNKH